MQTKIQNKDIAFGIDGSCESLSMAFFEGEHLIDFYFVGKAIHSITIVSAFDGLLKKTHINFRDIKILYLTIGPGRYSSLRVTLSAIKGLFFDFSGLVYCVNTMDLIAAGCSQNDYVSVTKKTSKGDLTQYYSVKNFVERLDTLNENTKECNALPDIKNLFKIDRQFFTECELTSIIPMY